MSATRIRLPTVASAATTGRTTPSSAGLQIWKVAGGYCASVTDKGSFVTLAGKSPGNTGQRSGRDHRQAQGRLHHHPVDGHTGSEQADPRQPRQLETTPWTTPASCAEGLPGQRADQQWGWALQEKDERLVGQCVHPPRQQRRHHRLRRNDQDCERRAAKAALLLSAAAAARLADPGRAPLISWGHRGGHHMLNQDTRGTRDPRNQGTRAGHAGRYAPGRNRTYDLALRRRTLYPLSYGRGGAVSLARVQVDARIVDAASSRRRSSSRARRSDRRRSSRSSCTRRRRGLRRGGADRAVRRDGRFGARVRRGARGRCSATTRSRSRRSWSGCPRGEFAARARSTLRCTTCRASSLGLPVWQLLGLRRAGPPTSWTIWLGDPDDMARRAEKARPRFRRLKLKLGGGDGLDVERVRAVRGVTDAAAAGRRERGAGRSTRRSTRCPARRDGRRSTASSRCPPATPAGPS